MVLSMFIQISRTVIDSFREAFQLFGDVWAPVVEACINLGASILFGYLWGLDGVLMGVNLSLFIIVLLWKPYYTFRNGMKSSVIPYFSQYVLHLAVLIAGAFIARSVIKMISYEEANLIAMILVTILGILVFSISTYTILLLCTKGMRMFTTRIRNILTYKI
jgi:hypothetical protein